MVVEVRYRGAEDRAIVESMESALKHFVTVEHEGEDVLYKATYAQFDPELVKQLIEKLRLVGFSPELRPADI